MKLLRQFQALASLAAVCIAVSCTRAPPSDHDVISVALVERVEITERLQGGVDYKYDSYEIAGETHDFRVLAADFAFDDWRQRQMRITLHPDGAVRFGDWTAENTGKLIGICIDGRMVAVRDLEGRSYDTLFVSDFELSRVNKHFDPSLRFQSANTVRFVEGYEPDFTRNSWIELERTSCEQRCPVYSVRVLGNGMVIYKGTSGVAQLGERNAVISYEATRRLLLRFAAADFFALSQSTTERAVDLPSLRVTCLLNGQAKRLESQVPMPGSTASMSETDKLLDLLAWAIDFESMSTRWTGRIDAQQRIRAPRDRPYAAGDPQSLEIRLRRNGCFGRCPIYELVIRGDGAVTFKGEAHVGVTDAETSISGDMIEELLDRLQELGFWEMQDRYDMSSVTDIPSMDLELRIGDRSKTVVNRWTDDPEMAKRHGFDLGVHREIESVASAIDAAVDARSWIHPRHD